jgi:hypothetical protein
MKYFFLILSSILLFACSSEPSKKGDIIAAKTQRKKVKTIKPIIPININYDSLDGEVKNQVKILDSIYGRTPYYANVYNKKIFIVLKGKFNKDSAYYLSRDFSGRLKYGIVDENLKLILPCDYDKIYNPNLTAVGCMEIKKGDEIGLFNLSTHEILEPQFEYISPSSVIPDNIAYGFKDGNWYKIEYTKKFTTSKASFSPVDVLTSLSFNLLEVKTNLMYSSYDEVDDPEYGRGVAFTPSYIEHLNIMPETCEDLIIPEQQHPDFGTEQMSLKTDTVKSITDKIISFIVSFYNEGIDGRGWVEDSKEVVVYNKEQKTFITAKLNSKYGGYDNLCHPDGFKFVNDSILEVMQTNYPDSIGKRRYDFENTYSYKLITPDGNISNLQCNRYFNFTKYHEIDESYFEGCYAKFIDEKEGTYADGNIGISEHLTLDDLDLMVNEIYAEYGFKFKSSKWKDYFSKYSWYNPQFDNVDAKLNKIDKKNIETISKEKAKMKGKENDYVKKRKDTYQAAG